MVLASTWTDPVLGVDTHILMVPAPPAPAPIPTPTPLPFTGMVLDPIGAAIGAALGAPTILINGLLNTNCGTNVYNIPFHPPFPPTIQGKAGNDAELWFGAIQVEIGGSLAVRLGDLALSCADPVRLPTSVVLAIPKGPLVIIPRPQVPDLKVIAFSLALKGVFAGFKWFRNFQKTSAFWESLSEKLRNKVNKGSRFRSLWSKAVCFATAHPVDVASGRVFTSHIDLELPGSLPLRFERDYSSAISSIASSLGHGWAHNYDEAVWAERGCMVYRASEGRELEFDTLHLPEHRLAPGRSVYLPHARLTLRALDAHRCTVTDPNGLVKEFSAVPGGDPQLLRLVSITNRLGEQQRLLYDDRGHLAAVYDPAGRYLRLVHDALGQLLQVTVVGTDGVEVPVVRFTYTPEGDLAEAYDALGHAYRYEYVNHLLVKETNRNGLSFYFQYDHVDERAKCVRTWGDGGIYDHAITYSGDGKKTTVENSLGHVTVYEMNDVGQVVKVTDALGRATAYEYDEVTGLTTKETAGDGGVTLHEYDERGNLTKVVQADGSQTTVFRDGDNQPLRLIDAIGGEWQWRYDPRGRLVDRRTPLGATEHFHWDGANLVAFVDSAGQRTRLGYDTSGNLSSITTPDDCSETWQYDGLGRIAAHRDVNGNTRTVERDARGQAVRLGEADGNIRNLTCDAEGNVTHVRDRHNDVHFEYAGMNRVIARSQSGTRIEFLYDTEENLTALKNEHGLVYRFVLDATGEVAEEYGFDDLRRRFVRDAAGRVTLTARPEGRTTEYTYDAVGRVLSVVHSDGSKEEYAYREDGELLLANNDSASVAFERDALGRIVRETQGDDWVASEYGPLGLRYCVTSSKGLFQRIQRNAMGDVLSIEATVGAASGSLPPTMSGARPAGTGGELPAQTPFSATFERDRLGLELQRSLPGGIRSTWQRDQLGRPVRQEVRRGSDVVAAKQYVWDVNDRLKRVIDAMKGPVDYHHDALGNLAAAHHADGRVELRMPDAVGNLFRTQDRTDRKYGPAGQLLEARGPRGVTRYEYDPEGNLAKKLEPDGGVWSYEWNGAGMLTKVVRPDGRVVAFAYDALGRRVSKRYRGKETRWVWDGNVPLHEWVERDPTYVEDPAPPRPAQTADAASVAATARDAWLVAQPAQGPPPPAVPPDDERPDAECGTRDAPITWVFEPESFAPLGRLLGGERCGIVTDHLGTPTAMYDAAGAEVWAGELDTYGELRGVRGHRQACPFRWPGQYEDAETGLYYNRFRYYDPEAGEYVSADPIGLEAGTEPYHYASDPLGSSDPYGLKSCADAARSARPGAYYEAVRTAAGDLLVVSGPLSRRQAQARLRRMMAAGDSTRGIYTRRGADARDLAASAGRGRPVRHPAHPDPATGSSSGRFPHYHPSGPHGGHVWYGRPHS